MKNLMKLTKYVFVSLCLVVGLLSSPGCSAVDVPENLCQKDFCTILHYYNRWDPADIPVLDRYDTVIFNETYSQLSHLTELSPASLKYFYFPLAFAPDYDDPHPLIMVKGKLVRPEGASLNRPISAIS